MGDPEGADEALLPDNFSCDHPDWRYVPGYLHYDTSYLLICDNLLDFSHLSYVHEKTFGGSPEIARATPRIEKPDEANLFKFLLARMIYQDGLNTLFAFGGVYAAGTFGMDTAEVIMFGITLNLTAGLGAFAFSAIDDRIGSKRTILIALGPSCLSFLDGGSDAIGRLGVACGLVSIQALR